MLLLFNFNVLLNVFLCFCKYKPAQAPAAPAGASPSAAVAYWCRTSSSRHAGRRARKVQSSWPRPPLARAHELTPTDESEAAPGRVKRQIERDADRQGRVSNHNETVSVAAWSMDFLLAVAPGARCRWRAGRAVIYSVQRTKAFWLLGHFMAHWDIVKAVVWLHSVSFTGNKIRDTRLIC